MHDQTRRVLDVLRLTVRFQGITHREIEQRLGWSRNYLGRLFSGEIELRFDHLPPLFEILHLDPNEFFQIAFPPPWPRPLKPNPLNEALKTLEAQGPASPALPAGPHPTEDELRELVRKLMDQYGGSSE